MQSVRIWTKNILTTAVKAQQVDQLGPVAAYTTAPFISNNHTTGIKSARNHATIGDIASGSIIMKISKMKLLMHRSFFRKERP